jgi:hypothetical protein
MHVLYCREKERGRVKRKKYSHYSKIFSRKTRIEMKTPPNRRRYNASRRGVLLSKRAARYFSCISVYFVDLLPDMLFWFLLPIWELSLRLRSDSSVVRRGTGTAIKVENCEGCGSCRGGSAIFK